MTTKAPLTRSGCTRKGLELTGWLNDSSQAKSNDLIEAVVNLPYPTTMSHSSDLRTPEFGQDSFALPDAVRVIRSLGRRHFFAGTPEFPGCPAGEENASDLGIGLLRNRSPENISCSSLLSSGRD
jgi:hypothetical protein